MEYLIRAVGFLFFLDLLAYLPFFRVFFGNRWLAPVWAACSLSMVFGGPELAFLGSGGLFVIFRYYFIESRWSSIRRGGGAPGFMSHWTILFLLLVQGAAFLDASGVLAQQTLTMMKVDFAWIMICAGVYKACVGYLHHDGMEYGRANPFWGYHWKAYKNSDPASLHVVVLNWLGSLVEIVAGVLMLTPSLLAQQAAALSITLGFVYVAAFIRLGRLAFLMMLLPSIFFLQPATVPVHLEVPGPVLMGLGWLTMAYMALLPLVKAVQYYNLFAKREVPQPLQGWVTAYANWVPIIIWRVFTADVTNFFIRVYHQGPEGEESLVHEDRTYSYHPHCWWPLRWKLRFLHVTESIALTSVFTTLKYFPSRPDLFEEKLLRYSQSLPSTWGKPLRRLRFEYVSIVKTPTCFEYHPVGNFLVDLENQRVERQPIVGDFDYAAPSRYSPCAETQEPGSYASASSRN